MKTELTLQLRSFPVKLRDQRTGDEYTDSIVLEKTHLQAAQLTGQSSAELIRRVFNRSGYHVIEIGKPIKKTVLLDLLNVWEGV